MRKIKRHYAITTPHTYDNARELFDRLRHAGTSHGCNLEALAAACVFCNIVTESGVPEIDITTAIEYNAKRLSLPDLACLTALPISVLDAACRRVMRHTYIEVRGTNVYWHIDGIVTRFAMPPAVAADAAAIYSLAIAHDNDGAVGRLSKPGIAAACVMLAARRRGVRVVQRTVAAEVRVTDATVIRAKKRVAVAVGDDARCL